ncbi:MAG: hypothetical protein KGL39_16365 [Patescibacteria group bacterium]|nr:hypothetical protein [Patescibacteria group bacterium]
MSEPNFKDDGRRYDAQSRPEDIEVGGQNAAYWQALHADIETAQKLLASIWERVPDGRVVVRGIGSPG